MRAPIMSALLMGVRYPVGHYFLGYCQDLHFTDEASQAWRGQENHQRPNRGEKKSKDLFAPRPMFFLPFHAAKTC